MVMVALIPARAGSKRIKHKNIKYLGDKPLIYYTIKAAQESQEFESIVVSTDSGFYAGMSRGFGVEVVLRPKEYATDTSPDIEWVKYTLIELEKAGLSYDCFAILRPTSPFRAADTIKRAVRMFKSAPHADSLRAVERCSQHPGKMFRVLDGYLFPILPYGDTPWHSNPTQNLPEVFVQNASLEIAWTKTALKKNSISGSLIVPFFTERNEGFDINTEEDFKRAEEIIRRG